MDRADMTAPMPETMSPREKVARAIKDTIRDDASIGLQMTMTPRFVNAATDRILAALASSGDHAELARDDVDCDTCDGAGEVEARIGFGTDYVPCPECVSRENRIERDAIIAEVAALRGESENARTVVAWANNSLFGSCGYFHGEPFDCLHLARPIETLKARAAEAERKLAEAVGLLREAASEIESEVEARYDGVKDHPSMTPKYERDMDTPQRINAFLSKEAERG